ncbi:MAG: nicotinate-nucleotide adenylyltransferase [Firmicutes bacterium]|nr:nicotinate-nucleotide adenylyltransferase [Bacillota bacterium]
MQKAIGILGGSFNPIHYGHLQMAQAAKDLLALDTIILIPDGDPPHKDQELADKYDRLRMTELAAGNLFEVSPMEVDRPGKTYTVDTLEALVKTYPGTDFILLIGADTLWEISGWRNPARVFSLCRFAVFSRGDMPFPEVPGAFIQRVDAAILDISATEIRRRVRLGMSLEGLTPPAVIAHIGRRRLYHPPDQLCKKEIQKRLQRALPDARFKHVLGVKDTIEALAKHWGMDAKAAGLAGLLHDCAKGLPLDELRRVIDSQGERVDALRLKSHELLHAPASAAMARGLYGVTDPDVLHAIWYHNTGSIVMGELDKLLYVADMIEPNRKPYAELEDIRRMAAQDLDEAVRMTLYAKLRFIQSSGREIHPDTKAALMTMQKENEARRETIW